MQHVRMFSGDVVWCAVCGVYGEHKARGLTQYCQGKFEGLWKGGGRVGQLKALKSCKHPKTGKRLPRAVTENEWLDGKRTSIGSESAGVLQSVPESLEPLRLCRTSAAILDRLRMKRQAGQEAAEVAPSAKRRLI